MTRAIDPGRELHLRGVLDRLDQIEARLDERERLAGPPQCGQDRPEEQTGTVRPDEA